MVVNFDEVTKDIHTWEAADKLARTLAKKALHKNEDLHLAVTKNSFIPNKPLELRYLRKSHRFVEIATTVCLFPDNNYLKNRYGYTTEQYEARVKELC